MSLDFQVSIRGVAESAHDIESIGQRAMHAQGAMAKILALLLKAEQALWKRHGGKKWPPLADGSTATLHQTGTLEDSLTKLTAKDAIREVTPALVDFGTADWIARVHQGGTKDGRLPARPVLVFRGTDKKAAREIILAHLMGREL